MTEKITCLAGGVGAAKFLQGLVKVTSQENVTIIVNTGDDMELYGLQISPDPDIVMYTLAGIVDEEKGWGIRDDTFNCLDMFRKYGLEAWFKLGDKDLATHIIRTQCMKKGLSLGKTTQRLCEALEVKARILPATNDKITPKIFTAKGKMHFEEYLVKRGAKDNVLDVVMEGVDSACPAPGVVEAICTADGVIICPSNPIVSVGPILSLKGIREALRKTEAKIVAISPIVGGATIKGPADKLMRGLGLEVSAYSVASLYRDFLDVFVIDTIDATEKERIEGLGIKVVVTNTIMRILDDKIRLAKVALDALAG